MIDTLDTYKFRARVVRVIDGDTVVLTVDLGFRIQETAAFRLEGINAPERGKEGWPEAKKALEDLIGGKEVLIRTSMNPADKYGRWLCTIEHEEQDVNQWMIDNGHAVEYGQ